MTDLTAIVAAVSGLNAVSNLAKTAVEAHDSVVLNTKLSELYPAILAAQSAAIDAKAAQSDMIDEIRQLKQQIADLEKWDAEAEKYSLREVGREVYAYTLDADTDSETPSHMLCAHCFENRKKSILQRQPAPVQRSVCVKCPACGTEYVLKARGELQSRPPQQAVMPSSPFDNL